MGFQRDRMGRHLKHAGHRSYLFDMIRSTRHGDPTVLYSKAYHSEKSEIGRQESSNGFVDSEVGRSPGPRGSPRTRSSSSRRYSASPSAITVAPTTIPISSLPSNL